MSAGLAAAYPAAGDSGVSAKQMTPTPPPVGTFAPPSEAPVTPIPSFVAPVHGPDGDDTLNILLLGSDTSNVQNAGRTDVIMVVSLNRTQGTVSLLSVPRDLFVYIPGWTMQRINTAFGYGQHHEYPGGGYGLLKDTLLYNLGLSIDFYARVDFADFQYIIDSLGGVDVTVDCAIQDWMLSDPAFDPQVEANWELFTLPVGVHRLDGATALWYARSRRTSSDFDRGRRQQDLMRSIWHRLQELGLIGQLPQLWGQVEEIVDTDMTLPDMLGLMPMGLSLDTSRIAHYTFESGVHVHGWQTPGGSAVQLPEPEAVTLLMQHFLMPQTDNLLVQNGPVIEMLNASGYRNLDRVAAARLGWNGFVTVAGGSGGMVYQSRTVIYDYSGRAKGSALPVLLDLLRLDEDDVIVQPDPNRAVDYRVVLGGDFRVCTHNVIQPSPEAAGEDAGDSAS